MIDDESDSAGLFALKSFDPVWAIGLMTGTVLDGNIDIALIKTDGERVYEVGPFTLARYDSHVIDLLAESLQAARSWQFNGPEPDIFSIAEQFLTIAQSDAVLAFLEKHGLAADTIGVVGFHGQSVLHRAPSAVIPGKTRQLGDGALMAARLGIPVVHDFRTADMQAGGQGAPLAAIYHAALLHDVCIQTDISKIAVLNLGGVGNITWTDGDGKLIAFDTGPANAPINDFIKHQGLGDMDTGGALAAQGKVDETKLEELLGHPYFSATYPKSLDRFDFSADVASNMTVEAGAALLTAFCAASVGKALDLLPNRPEQLIVCGGGRHNPTLMGMLKHYASVEVVMAENAGWRGDATEAECFAFLAVRTLRGLPLSFPSTTGAREAVGGGVLTTP